MKSALLAPDLAALQAFVAHTGQPLGTDPSSEDWLAIMPSQTPPRLQVGQELVVLLPPGPLSLRSAEQIEAADRVLLLQGADPEIARALTAAPVMPLQEWERRCPRRRHARSQATWERALSGQEIDGARLIESRLPLDLPALEKALVLAGALRVVGMGWSLSRPESVLKISATALERQVGVTGTWWVGTRHGHWPTEAAHLARIQAQWHPDYGDRHMQLVVIGGSLDLSAALAPAPGFEGAAMVPPPPF